MDYETVELERDLRQDPDNHDLARAFALALKRQNRDFNGTVFEDWTEQLEAGSLEIYPRLQALEKLGHFAIPVLSKILAKDRECSLQVPETLACFGEAGLTVLIDAERQPFNSEAILKQLRQRKTQILPLLLKRIENDEHTYFREIQTVLELGPELCPAIAEEIRVHKNAPFFLGLLHEFGLVGKAAIDELLTDKTLYSLWLLSFGTRKIGTIKEIRKVMRIGLRLAKRLSEDTPTVIGISASKIELERIQSSFDCDEAILEIRDPQSS